MSHLLQDQEVTSRPRAGRWPSHLLTPDTTAAFRASFDLPSATLVTLRLAGAHAFRAWLDGDFLADGPWRFPPGHPEYETLQIPLSAGRHVVAASVRHEGINSRLMQGTVIPPFLLIDIFDGRTPVQVAWKAQKLDGCLASGQRVSPQFAWLEWIDMRLNPADWHRPDFDDSTWEEPAEVELTRAWAWQPVDAEPVKRVKVIPKQIAAGTLSGPISHVEKPDWSNDDDPDWYRRNLQPDDPINGVWRRYDLGHVMLGAPEFELDVPSGTVVEIAYAESLREGRVTPFIPLSCGLSRNLDHFVARGGPQTFSPLIPKGGRFLEIHIGAPPGEVRFLRETFWQRTYYLEATGSLRSGDDLLDRIWVLGLDTLRGCSEDAITDNPTRERGQWTGDVLLAVPIAAAGFNDVRLFQRALRQAAFSANEEGLVAGLCPGDPGYLSTYAAQWVTAALDYFHLTGDRELLRELFPFAVRNLAVFSKNLTADGLGSFGWAFIDWGYPGSRESKTEMGLNLHYAGALRSMQRWCDLLGEDASPYSILESRIRESIAAWLQPQLETGAWENIGYHCTALALQFGMMADKHRPAAINYLKWHILRCFPNDPAAPRLTNPEVKSDQLITPYFAHFVFPQLIEAGEMDFVLEQQRICWGWGLSQGLTTQAEVFDLGWSHCHIWASSPTAQLSRYLLGLRGLFSAGINHFELELHPGTWPSASGKVPLVGQAGAVSISWSRETPGRISYEIETPTPIWIHGGAETEPVPIQDRARLTLVPRGPKWILAPA